MTTKAAPTPTLAPDHTADFMPLNGIDHVELFVGNAAQASFFFQHAFGFRPVAYAGLETGRRTTTSWVLEQGRIRIVLTGALSSDTEVARHQARHGDGIRSIALSVPDVDHAFAEATRRGARGVAAPADHDDLHGTVRQATIAAYGDTLHTFVDRADYSGPFLPGFERIDSPPPESEMLLAIDHIVGNVDLGHMEEWVSFYEDVFGMVELIHFSDEAISTEYSALMSKVVASGNGRIKFPINEPAEGLRKSQIDEYLEFYEGAGAQHIALATRDIVATVAELRKRGIAFLTIPDAYYDEVPDRVPEVAGQLADLREQGILVDHDDEGYLLQIFTKPIGDRPTVFLEIIERHGATGFGAGNFKALFEAIEREQDKRGESLMRYAQLGDIPAKRHVQFRQNGTLLTEEVLGFEGFSGNESILYHLHSPCRVREVGLFEPIVREEWVPETHVHRLTDTNPVEPGGDWLTGRRLLQFNGDIEVSICKPTEDRDGFYRNGEGDEVLFIHHGTGIVETIFGDVPYRPHDYVVIPRGTTYRVAPDDGDQVWLCFHTPGEIETPNRYRNRYGQLLEHAPFSQRDFHPPAELHTHTDRADFELTVRVRDGYQTYHLDYHPFDVVGWDGYVYPYTFNTDDFEPITGRIHMPPPVHQTFQGQNFVICSFCPRELDYDPQAIALPYHHSNVQSEEAIYYVDGQFGSRKGVDIGMITLHPSGLPHGPQPGLVEASLGARRTEELAVMWDTFKPLKLTPLARDLDQPDYALSWYEPDVEPATTTTG